MQKIGFIGLDIMRKPMAKNLIHADYSVIACDIYTEALEEMVSYGAKRSSSCKEVASQCAIIITMLPNSPEAKEVVLGKNGIIEGEKKRSFS